VVFSGGQEVTDERYIAVAGKGDKKEKLACTGEWPREQMG